LPGSEAAGSEDPFVVVAPAGRDADVLCNLLRSAGLGHVADNDGETLLRALVDGAAAGAIVTDEAIARIDKERLKEAIERQPPWSDFPFVLLSRRGEPRHGSRTIEELVNVTVLERPLHPATLLSAARSALRGRSRQRLAARHLEELEQARAALRRLADTLEEKVDKRTRDLAAANERLTREIAERERAEARLVQAQKMEAIGQLTGGIAHDFNNLLTAVVGSLDLLLRRTDEEKLAKLARNALKAAERGADLTAQLLAFSRRQRLTPTPVQPNEIIVGMGDMMSRAIGSHVEVATRLDPELWVALADPTQLEVMILNLAINARDAMPEGGRLTITTRNIPAVPAALAGELEPGAYVAIAVTDTGIGMAPSVLAKAFEPFFTTKIDGKGTGLGLAQLYGFAKQSGGSAKIVSREGQGTTVTIYLPRTHGEMLPAAEAEAQPEPEACAKVLIVDDDEDVRQVAAAMVAEAGYEVETAESGTAALARLDGGRDGYGLIITDVVMPGLSGVELARRVRKRHPTLPVIFASGYADLQTFGSELSEERVLKKPYRIAEIAAHVGAVLRDAAGRRAEAETSPA
jgi:signal transduction histidine kinase/ActR/RegA family two-component response regulator